MVPGYRKDRRLVTCGSPPGERRSRLEREPCSQLECAAGKLRARDLSHSGTSDTGIRYAEAGVVKSIRGVEPELNLTVLQFGKSQHLGRREVNIRILRSA